MKQYHVFSNKIIEISRELNCYPNDNDEVLTKAFNNIKNYLYYTCATVTTNSNCLEMDKEDMYGYLFKYQDIYTVVCWINKNILMQIDTLESKTLDVRLRIATSMLNKVIQTSGMNYLVGILIHDNFVRNLRELYYDLNTDCLPF